jgi:hypothetical protein
MINLKDFIDMCDTSFLLYVYDAYEDMEGPIWEGYSTNLLKDRNNRDLLDCYITEWGMTDEGTNEFIIWVTVER